jgi:multiple sugar transport system permease protein
VETLSTRPSAPHEQSPAVARPVSAWARLAAAFDNEATLGYLLMAPVVLILVGLVGYPFVMALWLSLTDKTIGNPGNFVGFQNLVNLWQSSLYQQAVRNTIVFTAGATLIKFPLGFALALLLNEKFPARKLVRAAVLVPWIVPSVLSAMAWMWLFTPNFSVLNWILAQFGARPVPWLTDPSWAMFSVILVNAWRATPFYAITLLAGLQGISPDLYEAAAIDGANAWGRFRHITFPLIVPILAVTMVLSIIWTFSEFQTVYALTGGGPRNSTHLLATLSYSVGLGAGKLGEGAAISLTMLPVLLLVVVWQLRQLSRSEP